MRPSSYQYYIATSLTSYCDGVCIQLNSTLFQTVDNGKRAKISDICLTGREGRDSALTDVSYSYLVIVMVLSSGNVGR